jgi:hypothetical protein
MQSSRKFGAAEPAKGRSSCFLRSNQQLITATSSSDSLKGTPLSWLCLKGTFDRFTPHTPSCPSLPFVSFGGLAVQKKLLLL